MNTSLEQARALRTLGMGRGKSHHRWYWWPEGTMLGHLPPELSCPGTFGSGVWYDGTGPDASRFEVEWCDAPDVLTALEWASEAKVFRFGATYEQGGQRTWWADGISLGRGPLSAPTADELLSAVLAALAPQDAPGA